MQQIDRIRGLIGSIAMKAPCKVATTEPITLHGAQTIDDVLLTADAEPYQRVLVKDQADTTENGIYDVRSGAWDRSPDFYGPRNAVYGTLVYVQEGTASGDVEYYTVGTDPIELGIDPITFSARVSYRHPIGWVSGDPGSGIVVTEAVDHSVVISREFKVEEIPTDFIDGSVPFADDGYLIEDNTGLHYDKTLHSLGVGLQAEFGYLDVRGWITSRYLADVEYLTTMAHWGATGGSVYAWGPAGYTDMTVRGNNVLLKADTHDGSTSVQVVDDGGDIEAYVDTKGGAVFNVQQEDSDFYISAVGVVYAFFVQGSDGNVGIHTNIPAADFHVVGDVRFGDQATNYASFAADGSLSFTGTATYPTARMLMLSLM